MLITFLLIQHCCQQSVQLKRRTLFRWSHSSFIQLYVFCICFQIFCEFYSNLYKCFLIENSWSGLGVGNIWKEEFPVSCFGKSAQKGSLAQFGLKLTGEGGGGAVSPQDPPLLAMKQVFITQCTCILLFLGNGRFVVKIRKYCKQSHLKGIERHRKAYCSICWQMPINWTIPLAFFLRQI